MALRYTHATDEAKRRAVENLAKPGGRPALSTWFYGGAEGDRTPDLRIANGLGPSLHGLTCSDMQ